jgi:flagellar hook-length control protein FliK
MTIAPKPPEDAAVAGIQQSKARSASKLKPEAMNASGTGSQKAAGPAKAGDGAGFAAILARVQAEAGSGDARTVGIQSKAGKAEFAFHRQTGKGERRTLAGTAQLKTLVNPREAAIPGGKSPDPEGGEAASLKTARTRTHRAESPDLRSVDAEKTALKAESANAENRKEAGASSVGSQAALEASLLVDARPGKEKAEAPRKEPNLKEAPDLLAGTLNAKKPAVAARPEGLADRLSVTDLRKAEGRSKEGRIAHGSDRHEAATAAAGTQQQAEPQRTGGTAELDLDVGKAQALGGASQAGEGRQGAETGRAEASPSRSFASVLADKLGSGWNDDIVKSAHIVLRDGDSGTIRLRLHPESLGGVKIELKLADNGISGKIIVESDEARNAFEKNMAQLQDAFTQGGFESARLEVQVGSGGSGAADGQAQQADGPFWSKRHGLESLARAVPEGGGQYVAAGGLTTVNLLA